MVTITITWQLIFLVVLVVLGLMYVPKENLDWLANFIFKLRKKK